MMTKLATNHESVMTSIQVLNASLPYFPDLQSRLGHVRAYYVLEGGPKPLFGFSKFVGYDGMTAEEYIATCDGLDGLNTEAALKEWFEEVSPGTRAYAVLFEQLKEWLATFGRRPRGGDSQIIRIMVLKPEYRNPIAGEGEDRRLLELLVAVADLLPTHQRHELRAAL